MKSPTCQVSQIAARRVVGCGTISAFSYCSDRPENHSTNHAERARAPPRMPSPTSNESYPLASPTSSVQATSPVMACRMRSFIPASTTVAKMNTSSDQLLGRNVWGRAGTHGGGAAIQRTKALQHTTIWGGIWFQNLKVAMHPICSCLRVLAVDFPL